MKGTCTKLASPNYKIDGFVQVDVDEEALRQAVDELGYLLVLVVIFLNIIKISMFNLKSVCTVSIDVDSDPLFMSYKGGIYNGNGKCKSGVQDGNNK